MHFISKALALLAAGSIMLTGCHAEPNGDGSLSVKDWIAGDTDRHDIARSVGAFGTSLTQEAAGAAQDVISGLFEGSGLTSIADLMPTAEDLAGFLPDDDMPESPEAQSEPAQGEEQ